EVHDLGARVDARIGTSRGGDFDGRGGEALERILEVVLHSASLRLRLPATEGRAVVLEPEGDAQLQRSDEFLRFFLLLAGAFLRDFLEDLAGAVLVADLEIRLGELELRADRFVVAARIAAGRR